ncbi:MULTISPECIES: ABC transporter substrate-binding protein [Rhizobium]|uniref:ABC transporter substrate-binding protein n=1 Tax=Rhizobium TaxID=379 RepID=UPI0007E9E194|nr:MULTISPECIES: ABC transporter substrate-binding protein [Rhizobium]ANK91611.1 proline/glycine betaine ABC transporter substrate-binding protein [Rhizobium sp. N6212]ANK97645.1 proline/glycine betaine ABC transporter substrate-binding protein [Rhizobium sp. N621]ANL03724.1 proline/glycine betaine ABC transporter substrate-binding protein [Rhizobium esperanzae]ANL09770.1 proline/glycine betaine ABC transporter substrate-binding protein [Rhizobium sp. N1341]ANL21822.1 proline/glycine betaine A
MKRLITSATMALSVMTASPSMAFQPESDQTIKLMIADWSSMAIDTEILNIILSTYGYKVEKVVADDTARYPGFEAGDLTIALETWQTTQNEVFSASLATGKILDMGELGPHAKEDWWYPAYMEEKCPGLPDWQALKNCAEAFSTPETAPKGRYLGAPVSWGGYDEERIKALDLPFEVVHAGTDAAMFAELKSAYERKAPIILWVYEPHWAPTVFKGSFIKFPAYEPACYSDAAWGVNPKAAYDCSKPEGWIKKMAWAGGEKVWPCAYDITRKFTIDGKELGQLVYEVDVNGRTVEDVAMEWAKKNEATWRSWAACAEK